MRTFGAAIVAGSIFFAFGASAQTTLTGDGDSYEVQLSASVPAICYFSADLPTNAVPIALTDLIDQDDATINATASSESGTLSQEAYCNDANNTSIITIESEYGGLTQGVEGVANSVENSAGFLTEIEYELQLTWGGTAGVLLSSDDMNTGNGVGADAFTSIGAVSGSLDFAIGTTSVTDVPLEAGTYTDTITIRVDPTT